MDSLEHSEVLVADNEPDAGKASFFEPDEEASPALVVFLHAFGSTEDLTIAVLANSAPPACRFRFKRRGRSDTNGAGFRPIGVNIRARVIVPS